MALSSRGSRSLSRRSWPERGCAASLGVVGGHQQWARALRCSATFLIIGLSHLPAFAASPAEGGPCASDPGSVACYRCQVLEQRQDCGAPNKPAPAPEIPTAPNSCPGNISGFEAASATADQERQTWSKALVDTTQILQAFRASAQNRTACIDHQEAMKRASDLLATARSDEAPKKENFLTACAQRRLNDLLVRIHNAESTMPLVLTGNQLTKILIHLQDLQIQYKSDNEQLGRFSQELEKHLRDCEMIQ
jgi:hypothetical protein